MFDFRPEQLKGQKALAYFRKSPDKEDSGKETSIENQKQFVYEFATKFGIDLIHELIETDVSGSLPIDKRPSFSIYLEQLNNDIKPNIIVVKDISRFGREYGFHQSLKLISDIGINLISTDLAENNPSVRNMKSMFNTEIINSARYYTTRTFRLKVAKGLPLNRLVYGYVYSIINNEHCIIKDVLIKPNVEEIQKEVLSEHIKEAQARKLYSVKFNISDSTVYSVLHNPTYAGMFKLNNGFYLGIHEPYLTKAEFVKLNPLFFQKHKLIIPEDIDFTNTYGKEKT